MNPPEHDTPLDTAQAQPGGSQSSQFQPLGQPQLEPVELDLNLAHAFRNTRRWDAYERLLLDVIEGDSTLFMRRDEVEAAWRWVDPILNGWQEHYRKPRPYPAGTDGPEQADRLTERHGRQWSH